MDWSHWTFHHFQFAIWSISTIYASFSISIYIVSPVHWRRGRPRSNRFWVNHSERFRIVQFELFHTECIGVQWIFVNVQSELIPIAFFKFQEPMWFEYIVVSEWSILIVWRSKKCEYRVSSECLTIDLSASHCLVVHCRWHWWIPTVDPYPLRLLCCKTTLSTVPFK